MDDLCSASRRENLTYSSASIRPLPSESRALKRINSSSSVCSPSSRLRTSMQNSMKSSLRSCRRDYSSMLSCIQPDSSHTLALVITIPSYPKHRNHTPNIIQHTTHVIPHATNYTPCITHFTTPTTHNLPHTSPAHHTPHHKPPA